MTDQHTCHDHCPCQPPGTEAEYLGYTPSKDRLCRDLEAVIAADTEEVGPSHWVAVAATAAWSVFEQWQKHNPPPDLARGGDAQSEVGESLWWQVWHAMNRLPRVCGKVSEEALDDCTNAALSVVQPELDRHIGAHRRDNQRHANLMHGLREAMHEESRRDLERLRSELADMTTQRDRWRSALANEGAALAESERELSESQASAKLYLKERDEALKERDDAIRSADAVTAEREASDVHADRLLAERDEWRREYSKERAQSRHFEEQRDTAQAEVKELREERDAAVANADRLAESLRNELNRNSDLRGDRDGWKHLCQSNTDNLNGDIDKLTAERDALQASLTDRNAENDRMVTENARLDQENDALQARIDDVARLADYYDEEPNARDTGRSVAVGIRASLRQSAPPADCEMEYPSRKGEIGDPSLLSPADDGSEANSKPDAESALESPPRYSVRDAWKWKRYFPAKSDAENESPPFTVGQWVRIVGAKPEVIPEVGRVDYFCPDHESPACFVGGYCFPTKDLEPWRPVLGESVIHVGGAHEYPSMVTQVYGDGERFAVLHNVDRSESVVIIGKLRPDVGSEQ